jgi:predicted metal-binding protein
MKFSRDEIHKEIKVIRHFPCSFLLTVLFALAPIVVIVWKTCDTIYRTRLENSESTNKYLKDKLQNLAGKPMDTVRITTQGNRGLRKKIS